MSEQNKKNIILHVGLHKTGSTFLQKQIFPFLQDVYFTGTYLENTDYDRFHREFWHLGINYKNNSKFTDEKEFLEIKMYVSSFINNIEENNFLFSFETLFGNCWKSYHNNFDNTELLKQIFPEAKIFIVIRKQDDWIKSAYVHYAYKGANPVSINSFIGYKKENFNKSEHINIQDLNWTKYIENYMEKYGRENVFVLPYELLKNNPEQFLTNFYDFFELKQYFPNEYKKENEGPALNVKKVKPLSFSYNNFIDNLQNNKLKSFIIKNDRGIKYFLNKFQIEDNYSNQKLTENQKEQILKIHEESNRKLSKLIGIDLGQYGYY